MLALGESRGKVLAQRISSIPMDFNCSFKYGSSVRESTNTQFCSICRGPVYWSIRCSFKMSNIPAISISYPVSGMTANSVGNILLAQANEQIIPKSASNTIQTGMPITSDNFDLSPVFAAPKVEALDVAITNDIFTAVYGLSLLISLIAVCVASVPAMRMKPKEILSKMLACASSLLPTLFAAIPLTGQERPKASTAGVCF